jgi:alcohol dehydrogenase class IV
MNKIALIVHSKHTKNYAMKIGESYDKVYLMEISSPPANIFLKRLNKKFKDIYTVIGIGGGSVIDTAKIIAMPKRCIAIPTTASGACMTPYATIWGKEKQSVTTKVPIVLKYEDKIELPDKAFFATYMDCWSHILESLASRNKTERSEHYVGEAIKYMTDFVKSRNMDLLIKAGNYAGKAIAITKTNIIHAISYPLTTEYGISHGLACGLLLPYFADYIIADSIKPDYGMYFELIKSDYRKHKYVDVSKINPEKIATLALRYPKIQNALKPIKKEALIKILQKIKNDYEF